LRRGAVRATGVRTGQYLISSGGYLSMNHAFHVYVSVLVDPYLTVAFCPTDFELLRPLIVNVNLE
jgi:hypothetical protein